ncbi:MAG: hypothetical protein D6794_06790 [Deltaproteobacteria bacterium]|nr:MAG: hypothetical protein D6794_06790 [Deltaproteobacteria bacterium]
MRRKLLWGLLILVLLPGCGGGRFHVSKQDYQQQVRTLGVVPLLVDAGSFAHPEAERLIELLWHSSRDRHTALVEQLRRRDRYFDIRRVEGDPAALAARLIAGSSLTRGGDLLYRDYRFQPDAVAALCSDNLVDGLLVVILSEIERVETRRDRIPVNYLKAPFRSVQVRAYVVLPDGRIAWSFPADGSRPFVALQYPDFDEAYYNRTDEVRVKNISLAGVKRALAEGGDPKKTGPAGLPEIYAKLFSDIVGGLAPLMDRLF